jgi:hypothetical protein
MGCLAGCWAILSVANLTWGQADATVTHTSSGLQFTGIATNESYFLSPGSKNDVQLISVLEGARRIIFPQRGGTMVTEVRPAGVTFDLRQDLVSASNANISAVGSTLQTLPFNEFGRRKVYVDTNKGPVWLLQGITHLDPGYVRVQGVQMPEQGLFGFPFDFRVATTTLPGELLVRLLRNATDDLGDYQQRERIVEFLINAERYNEAIRELNQLQVDFSDLDQQRFDAVGHGFGSVGVDRVGSPADGRANPNGQEHFAEHRSTELVARNVGGGPDASPRLGGIRAGIGATEVGGPASLRDLPGGSAAGGTGCPGVGGIGG